MSDGLPFVASSSRPVRLRVRPDLIYKRHRYQGANYWVVKDPVSLNYFRFPPEEVFILKLLDGALTLDQIEHRYNMRFAPRKMQTAQLQDFLGSMHRTGLVHSLETGQGTQLYQRGKKNRLKRIAATYSNVLAIRYKGIDPDRFLTWLSKYTNWFFTAPALLMVTITALAALIWTIVHWDGFFARLPTFYQFFSPVSFASLIVVLAVTKIIHELGHGLACKRFGGECHEIGVMLLVLTPCLYCNVTDSWILPNKWHRAAIGAAGMYVEIFLASIATFLWWSTEHGFVNQLFLQIVFISSISTVIFNGNPLLRFDGYYIMSDLLEIPNLHQKGTNAWQQLIKSWLFGFKSGLQQMMPRYSLLFIGYTAAAIAYRWFVVVMILIFLNQVFEPYGLKIVGQLIALFTLSFMLGMPLYRMFLFFFNPLNRYQIKMKRTLIGTTVLLIALGTILFLPLPHYVDCEFQIRPKNVTQVYIRVPGEIREVFVNQGDEITAGSSILQTTNPDLELLHSRQQGKLATIELQVDLFKKSALNGNEYSQRQLSSSLAELKNQIQLVEKTKALLDQLTIVAPVSGTILPVNDEDNVDARTSNVSNEIRVFDPEFSNSPLPIGFLVCQIGDPLDLEAVMMIDEKQMDFVRPGQTVQFRTASRTWNQLESKLASLERQNNKQDQLNLPTSSSNSNHPAAASDPLTANYMATAKLQADDPQVLFMSGRARIYTGNRTIGNRLMRWFADTFRFQL